jgi:hypothetical protein
MQRFLNNMCSRKSYMCQETDRVKLNSLSRFRARKCLLVSQHAHTFMGGFIPPENLSFCSENIISPANRRGE